MNKPNDRQLDQWLREADQSLNSERQSTISFRDVQRQAERNQTESIARRKSFAAMVVVGMLLGGWMILAPNPSEQQQATVTERSNEDFDLAACQAEQQQIDQELSLLKLERQIKQMQLQLARTQKLNRSPELAYHRNRDSRMVFENIVDGSMRQLTKSDLWKLEVLIEGYPETDACNDAQMLLAQHNRPLQHFEKED